MLCEMPCAVPWDVKFGECWDVLTHGSLLVEWARAGKLKHVHLGTPCQSMTWARSPQLRSVEFPWGLPHLAPHQEELVSKGNFFVVFTAELCEALWAAGATFSVENPERSWLWILHPMRRIRELPGVEFCLLFFSDFMVPFRKPTLILHNTATWHQVSDHCHPWPGPLCTYRGQVHFEGKLVFKTHLAQTYPPLMCLRLAWLLREAWTSHPGAPQGTGAQLSTELVEVAAVTRRPPSLGPFLVPFGLGAPVGLSPEMHVEFARQVKHPASQLREFPQDVLDAIEFEGSSSAEEIDAFRSNVLHRVCQLASQLQDEQARWVADAPAAIQGLVARIHGPLWEALLQTAHVQAPDFLRSLREGFPIVGELPLCEGGAVPACFPSAGTVSDLRERREFLNLAVLKAVKEIPFSGDIGPQVEKDCQLGAMTLPRPLEPEDIRAVTLTRRIPVRELRSKGWRTRVVDHETEKWHQHVHESQRQGHS